MRVVFLIALAVAACGGSQKGSGGGGGGGAEVFVGARFVPPRPTYVVAAPTFRSAQLAFHDAADIFGMAVGGEVEEIGRALQVLLGIDPLNPDAVAQIGVDMNGALVAFSEDIDPTFVVHLADPKAMAAYLDGQRAQGMKLTSMIVDNVEVFTARIEGTVQVSWAIDKDWLWVHFADMNAELGTWFEHSHKAGAPTWTQAWDWAKAQASGQGLTGFANLRDAFAVITKRVPEAAACARQFESVARVGVSVTADGRTLDGHLSFDIGGSAQNIGGALLQPPPGWTGASQGMPVSAQWNLDAAFMQRWMAPCMQREASDVAAMIDQFGVRSARGLVQQFDPDDKSGVGAVSLDLTHSRFIAEQLDQVPMRSRLEKDRTYGQYKGKHLSVPFVATVDYVLTNTLFIGAMGDGLLAKLGSGAPQGGPPPIASVDVLPAGLKPDVWQWLFEQIGAPSPQRLAQRLQNWQNLHIGARLDGTSLVIEANGTRR
ncbi:MAG TPA: hypothetical protein VMZ53_18570 [Kofleriaceae bacterium]|nr:hypothetical protein [Kofleriaceae bacterium]